MQRHGMPRDRTEDGELLWKGPFTEQIFSCARYESCISRTTSELPIGDRVGDLLGIVHASCAGKPSCAEV
eukprot:2225644-Rhodomonas_salina.1